ncbi:MAG: AMP-binding protein [Deltaproteobacteria bacterium]|nr:AMP-binding protein [Deltaproteobacteria bacterium]
MRAFSAQRRLLESVRARGRGTALLASDRSVSWAELDDRLDAASARLIALGVRPGQRVACYAETQLDVVVSLLATHALGAVWVPINPGYHDVELGHVLALADATVVLCDHARLARAGARARPLSSWWTRGRPGANDVSDDELALLITTSGTTGRPKACMLSFANVVAAVGALSALWEMGPDDEVVHALPLFHVHGLCVALHGALLRGARTRLLESFTPVAVVDAIAAGGTVFMGVPTMYRRLLDHLDAHPAHGAVLARARLFTAGSAALPADDLVAFERHTGHRIVERYGMSETLITLSNPVRGERKAGTVGRPIPGVDMRVIDDELQVRGPGVMRGYYNDPAATAQAFTADGFLKTGDTVRVADDGYVTIVGRTSTDILKVGGYKLSTREIEEQLATHPAVREVAVVGVPDREWGQRVVACVVPRDAAAAPTLAELQAHVRLHEAKKPRALHLVDALPKNALGKVQKKLLADQLARAALG